MGEEESTSVLVKGTGSSKMEMGLTGRVIPGSKTVFSGENSMKKGFLIWKFFDLSHGPKGQGGEGVKISGQIWNLWPSFPQLKQKPPILSYLTSAVIEMLFEVEKVILSMRGFETLQSTRMRKALRHLLALLDSSIFMKLPSLEPMISAFCLLIWQTGTWEM